MPADDDNPTTGELRAVQEERATPRACRRSRRPSRPSSTHERRAEKAAYLAEKLDEQAEALDE
jgi:hypothetical protein